MPNGPPCEFPEGCRAKSECATLGKCVKKIPLLTDDCPDRLERAHRKIVELAPRAAKWDALLMSCHRLGVKCKEIVEYINEKVRGR